MKACANTLCIYMKIETFYLTEIVVYFKNDCFLNISFAYCTRSVYPNFTKFTENKENSRKKCDIKN